MALLKREKVEAAVKAESVMTNALQAALSAAPAPKAAVEVAPKAFTFSRRNLPTEPGQVRQHLVLNVPGGTEYSRCLEPETYRGIADAMRPGDLVELRFEPNLSDWALLLVVGLRANGVEVRELLHKHFEDIAPAASIEELAGFRAEQTGINSWQLVRAADDVRLPEEYPTIAAARAAIARMAPQFVGRGWSRN